MKKILAFLLTAALLCTLLPTVGLTASAASGSCGGNLKWTFNENSGVLTVSGSGEMNHYMMMDPPWAAYRDKISKAVFQSGVTAIGSGAFRNCTALTAVQFPESLTNVSDEAFRGCALLKTVSLPRRLRGVGGRAFYGCGLTGTLAVPAGLTVLGGAAFGGCPALTAFSVDKSNPQYCNDAAGCLYSVGFGALEQLPGGFTGEYSMPDTVSTFTCMDAFCARGLTAIRVGGGNPAFSSDEAGVLYNKAKTAVLRCPMGLRGEYRIPAGTDSVGNYAFENCADLRVLLIGTDLKTVY